MAGALGLCAALLLARPATAADEFMEAFARGDYATALTLVRPLAESGNAVAQANLGAMYERGLGVSQDYREAVSWYRKSAEQGNAGGETNLGIMYMNGHGVSQDDKEAAAWYQRAADQGYVVAEGNLGWAYANGRGVPQDDRYAVAWWRKCADQGSADCQVKLGYMYENGRGVAQSDKEALTWYRKAASQGDTTAKSYIARNGRATTRFTSFEDARKALAPDLGRDLVLMQDPMSLKGQIIAVRLQVAQVLGGGRLLLTYRYMEIPGMDGKIFCGYIPATYEGSREFVDDQLVEIVGEVTGTYRYTTALNTTKTVPEIRIYGIR